MSEFYDELDSIELFEEHALEVARVEREQAEALLGTYQRVAKNLRARLSNLPADSFSAQHVRVVLIQLEGAIIALTARLRGQLDESAKRMAVLGVNHLTYEIDAMSKHFAGVPMPLNLDANLLAGQYADRRINVYEASVNAYSNSLRTTIAMGLEEAVIAKDGPDTIIRKLTGFFEGEEWRLRRIVRTELMGIYSGAKIPAMVDIRNKAVPTLKKTLYHPLDGRTSEDSKWLMANPLVVDIERPFQYEWPPGSGKVRTYDAPPDRPNDRSILIPYSESWQ